MATVETLVADLINSTVQIYLSRDTVTGDLTAVRVVNTYGGDILVRVETLDGAVVRENTFATNGGGRGRTVNIPPGLFQFLTQGSDIVPSFSFSIRRA